MRERWALFVYGRLRSNSQSGGYESGGVGAEWVERATTMSDIITGLRQVIQDMVAPDLKAHTEKLEALQKQTEMLQKLTEFKYDSIMKTFEAFRAEMRLEFAALRANNQTGVFWQLSPLSERVAVLEARAK